MKKILLLLFIIHCQLSIINCTAKNNRVIDSLLSQLPKMKEDTNKVKLLRTLCWEYQKISEYDKGLHFGNEGLVLAKKIDYKMGESKCYNNIGIIYRNQGNYNKALENHLASLKLRLEIGDKPGIAASYNNIGNIYYNKNDYDKALENHIASLKMRLELGLKDGIAYSYHNIGAIYEIKGNTTKALENYFASLKLRQQLGDNKGIADCYNNIGIVYLDKSNYDMALENFFASLKIEHELGDKKGIVNSYNNIGTIFIKQHKIKEAKEHIVLSLNIAKQINSKDDIRLAYKNLAKCDSALGNWQTAFNEHKLFKEYNDSIFNEESTKKTVAMQMTYDFNKKQTADSIKASEEKKVIASELKQERTRSYALYGGLAVMILIAGVFLKQRNKIGKEKNRSEQLLLNILPAEVAEELKATGQAEAKMYNHVSVLFTDFVGFTLVSEKLSPKELVKEIHLCFTAFDKIIERNGLEKIKTIGDAYLAVCGMPNEDKDHAKKTVQAAIEIMEFINKRITEGGKFNIRVGINSGPVVAGIVGVKKFAYDIWGDTVNTAARMEQNSVNGKINISGSTYHLVKNDFKCEHRGKIAAKNKGEVDMYFVE